MKCLLCDEALHDNRDDDMCLECRTERITQRRAMRDPIEPNRQPIVFTCSPLAGAFKATMQRDF
jgi:hypothetical protein